MSFALLLLPMALARSQPTVLENANALLRDSSPAVREQGVTELARLGTAEATTQLITYFQRQPASDNTLSTARALASVNTTQAYQALVDALRRGQPASRRSAALTALREPKQYGGSDAEQDAIMNILVTAASTEKQPLCRLAAIESLGHFKDPRAVNRSQHPMHC